MFSLTRVRQFCLKLERFFRQTDRQKATFKEAEGFLQRMQSLYAYELPKIF